MGTPMILGRIERIVLTENDYVEVHDALGSHFRMPPAAARGLHRELGKFLALANDAKPLPQPTRADFRDLASRVTVLEQLLNGNEQ